MARMITVRVHLDEVTDENEPLRDSIVRMVLGPCICWSQRGVREIWEMRPQIFAEGMNSKIMSIKRRVEDYRNRENFKTAIYSYCGGLDLDPRSFPDGPRFPVSVKLLFIAVCNRWSTSVGFSPSWRQTYPKDFPAQLMSKPSSVNTRVVSGYSMIQSGMLVSRSQFMD